MLPRGQFSVWKLFFVAAEKGNIDVSCDARKGILYKQDQSNVLSKKKGEKKFGLM